jgi:hypothetical protein
VAGPGIGIGGIGAGDRADLSGGVVIECLGQIAGGAGEVVGQALQALGRVKGEVLDRALRVAIEACSVGAECVGLAN